MKIDRKSKKKEQCLEASTCMAGEVYELVNATKAVAHVGDLYLKTQHHSNNMVNLATGNFRNMSSDRFPLVNVTLVEDRSN